MLRAIVVACCVFAAQSLSAATLKILLPLERTAYQTNEVIDLAVVRGDAAALPAGELVLTVSGSSGSKLTFTFPAAAVALQDKDARSTTHLHLNGWLLRPDKYTIEVAADGATAKAEISVHSHVRKSSFKILQWGSRAAKAEQGTLGEDSLGFNLIYPASGGLEPDEFIRTGADYMWCCTMSGGHQMDLRQECDWSDPLVLRGGTARVARRALMDRTKPNAVGVHFYDEPGLTWWKHKDTGVMVPYNIPTQDQAYRAIFDEEPLQYDKIDESNPDSVAKWKQMNRWKEAFMEAAWKYSAFGVERVNANLLSVTQSVYGANAYADGYYFNVVRQLPIVSGHGGYDDYGLLYFNPSYTFQLGRMRQMDKPNWYLPSWYGNMPGDRFRMEQYLSFMDNLQGMAVPPDLQIHKPESTQATAGVVESNKLMARIGTIFNTMPVDRGEAVVLYSLSQALDAEVKDIKKDINVSAYQGGGHTRDAMGLVHVASRMMQTQIYPIVEEDVIDGTLAAQHKAVVLPTVNYLDPKTITALEAFAAGGGLVLVSDDSKVQIKGATKLGAATNADIFKRIGELWPKATAKDAEAAIVAEFKKLNNAGAYMQAAAPVAKALQTHFKKHGIQPAFSCDNAGIAGTRQAFGDIEYLFAVNASYDQEQGEPNSIKAATATIGVPADGRPVYDAMQGGPAEFASQGDIMVSQLHFGPGQMRVFARTARAIGGVRVAAPVVKRDLTAVRDPLAVKISAVLLDNDHGVLSGSAPMEIRLIDPLGVERYLLHRATDQGLLDVTLPLAANDPPGAWKVVVRELLSNTESSSKFNYAVGRQCGALAGSTGRGVSFGNDRENAFRFFRTFNDVTIVKGSSDYNGPAAERLVKNLAPWGIRARVLSAADAAKPREISAEEAPTWIGLEPSRAKPGRENGTNVVGFDVTGPVILLGTPADNPLIKFAADNKFLPYKTEAADFPGRRRGMLAWQRDAVGYNQESLTLIAYDKQGMSEAVGTTLETLAAMTPLTRWETATANSIEPAAKSRQPPTLTPVWQVAFADTVVALRTNDKGADVLTWDGTESTLDTSGKVVAQKFDSQSSRNRLKAYPSDKLDPEVAKRQQLAGFLPKQSLEQKGLTAIAYWGGTLRIVDAAGEIKYQQLLLQDITAMAWSGSRLIVGLAGGKLLALEPK